MDLESDFLAAADTLLQAHHLYKAGLVDVAPRLADDAVELTLKTLIPLPGELRGGRGREVPASRQYRYRREQARIRFGIASSDLSRLHSLRLVDRFREESDGKRRLITDDEARWALKNADQILRALINAPEVPEEVRRLVLERLDLQTEPSPEEELLDVVEHQVGWGHYDGALKSRLIYLNRLLATRRSRHGRGHHTRVLTLQAHAAMNLSQTDGPEGAIVLAEQAAVLWEDEHDRGRAIHVLKIQSISWREKNRPDLAAPLMDRALQIAGDDRELIDSVDSERASILLARGDSDGAARLVRDALERRRACGDALGEANYLRPAGKALMRSGQLIEAEIALRRAQELTPPDYLMAQCVLAVSLTELYATCGDKREAHRWAETARQLIEHRGYQHQGRVLEEIISRFTDIW
jgi:tetratricopeptide (TPR) repeat protein